VEAVDNGDRSRRAVALGGKAIRQRFARENSDNFD
jgi:hypothetical protein